MTLITSKINPLKAEVAAGAGCFIGGIPEGGLLTGLLSVVPLLPGAGFFFFI
jgi:hypothetical protein